jgi:hypothetical protein
MNQWFMEYAANPFKATTTEKAAALGISLGFIAPVMKSDWSEGCAVVGNTFAIKDTLKANGARWNGVVKAWTFSSYSALESAVAAIEVK